MTPRALLRVDADHEIGLGHAIRCQALLSRLPELRVDGAGSGGSLRRALPSVENWMPAAHGFEALARGHYDVLLMDHPEPDAELLAAAGREGVLVVRIDDFGFRGGCDLVINGAPGATARLYPGIDPARALCGPAYCLLRQEFATPSRGTASRPDIVAVVGSGAGALPFARSLARAHAHAAQAEASEGRFDLVVGAAFPADPKLEAACTGPRVRLHRGLESSPLAALLASASLAVTTGGMIVPECLALGVPLLAFAQVESVAGELEWLERQDALTRIPERVALDPKALAVELASKLADPDLRKRARRGRQLFDGRGARRVADALDALLSPQRTGPKEHACALR